MIYTKPGVIPKSLTILCAVANVAQEMGRSVTISAGDNGQHMITSKHYDGKALDIRSKDFPDFATKHVFLARVLTRLNRTTVKPAYQGLLENQGAENEHFHIEYDPK